MTDLPVTQVTENATRDDLSDSDYRDIYEELRRNRSLDAFCALVSSQYSKGWWSRYEHDDMKITRPARNELRRGVGLPQLPLTTEEAIHLADPDARVYRVGSETPRRVVLIGASGPVALRCDESGVTATIAAPRVRPVTRPRINVTVPQGIFSRLNGLRASIGLSWAQVFERMAEQLERETNA